MSKINFKYCLKGKFTSSFNIKESRSSQLLEVVYSDISGPMRKRPNGQVHYFITFIDDCSR